MDSLKEYGQHTRAWVAYKSMGSLQYYEQLARAWVTRVKTLICVFDKIKRVISF